jgi:hypothetical protein
MCTIDGACGVPRLGETGLRVVLEPPFFISRHSLQISWIPIHGENPMEELLI